CRLMGIKYFAKIVSFAAKQRLTDTTSGYRALNRRCIELFANYYPSDYPEVEAILYALSNNLSVAEVSVDMQGRQGGSSSITPLKSLYYMIKVTFSIIFLHEKEGCK
ncbi:MAG: glycosyltransferase family 2 protein, partial [Firmicutes bacterium]|nr:glycosyltransferase family 2 protein [Bacillota bacterium]